MDDEQVLSFEQIKKLKVAELKAQLSELGLHVSGLKADLVARLSSHYESLPGQSSEVARSETDVQATLIEVSDSDDDEEPEHSDSAGENLKFDSKPRPTQSEIIESDVSESDTQQSEPVPTMQIPCDVTHGVATSVIITPEVVSSPKDESVDSMVISEPPETSQDEGIPEEPEPDDSQPVLPVEPVSTVEDVSMMEPVSLIEPVQPISLAEAVQPVPLVEPVQPVLLVESVQPVSMVEPVQPVSMVEPVQPVPLVEPVQPVSMVEPVQPPPLVEPVQPVSMVEPVQPVLLVEPVQPALLVEPVQPVSMVEPVQPVSMVEPVQPVSMVEPVQPVSLVESVEPALLVEPVQLVPLLEPETTTLEEEVSPSSDVPLPQQSIGLEDSEKDDTSVSMKHAPQQEINPVMDDIMEDVSKRGEDLSMETSSSAYEEKGEPIKEAQPDQIEIELDSAASVVIPQPGETKIPVETELPKATLPDVLQKPSHYAPEKHGQKTRLVEEQEMDNSSASTEQIKHVPSPSNKTPVATVERTDLAKDDRRPGSNITNSAPRVDTLREQYTKARSLDERVRRSMNHDSGPGRGDDSGYDVDQGEQEYLVAPEGPRQEAGKKKKKKKKKRKKKRSSEQTIYEEDVSRDDEGIEVEYIPETLELDARDPVYAQFAQIFETFKLTEKQEVAKKDEANDKKDVQVVEAPKKDINDEEMDTDSEEDENEKKDAEVGEKVEKLSKKKLKLKNRMSVAELKQHVHRPDVVEMHDVTAPDPKLLVYLKACRNTVPVPRHWCFKRKFLQGKRGIIKPPFQLPEFIQKTGIMEMREALQEKEDAKNMKAKMREKVRPKMGKIDIDYQKLHDAFFKWQTKPKMSIHGDLYYEGKEFETKLKQKKPGDLSEELRTALGMPTGQGSNLVPPPWLIAMQRYGPPPSYPNLKVPGLNAPIPEGASFGYHAGGWGKPPVDEQGRPLYGDVFGLQQTDVNLMDDDQVDSTLWGELESESEESEESEEESEEEAPDQTGLITPAETGLVTPSGLTSIPAGMETPDMIELRKRKNIEEAMESGSEQPTLYTVLPEKRVGVGAMMMGSSHVYDLATAVPTGTKKTPGGISEGVEVALDPSELELDPAAMQARYDEQLREQQTTQKEDFSDMVAEHAARQQKKRKKTTDSGKAAKKYKEFKF